MYCKNVLFSVCVKILHVKRNVKRSMFSCMLNSSVVTEDSISQLKLQVESSVPRWSRTGVAQETHSSNLMPYY